MKKKLRKIFKKSVLGAMVVSSLLTGQSVFASSNAPIAGGSVDLDQINNELITPYNTEFVGGGVWNYGVGTINAYSHYQHLDLEHSATVRGILEKTAREIPGIEAKAETPKNPLGGNRAWWNTY